MTSEQREKLRKIDMQVGRCSGIPECCITHFVDVWVPNEFGRSDGYAARLTLLDPRPGYIPCPSCLASKSFVTVRRCPVGCLCGWR